MQYRELGKSGMKVSPICFGSWAAGGGAEWGTKLPDDSYVSAMRYAFENGINFVDSAGFYGRGHAEELIGQALRGFDREKIIVATKQVAGTVTREKARETIESALQRMGIDYLDVFLVHWPHPDVDIAENMDILNELKEKGLIRAIGASNYTLWHLKRAVQYARIDVIQPCYSLYWRHQLERDILPFCKENDIGIMTYSSIGQGILSGSFSQGKSRLAEGDSRVDRIPFFVGDVFPKAVKATQAIGEIGAKYGKTVVQTAINWVMNTPGITSAIVGAKTLAQEQENLGALGWELSPQDYQEIGAIGMEIADMLADWDTLFAKDHPMVKIPQEEK